MRERERLTRTPSVGTRGLGGKVVQSRETRQSHHRKLTRDDVLRLIEENRGAEGLDLSGRDLHFMSFLL